MFKIILQLHGGGGGKGGGGGGSTQSGYTNMDVDTTKTTNPFTSDESKQNYNAYNQATQQNYQTALGYQPEMLKSLQNANNLISQYTQQGKIGDDSYFKQGWSGATGIDQSNLNKLNSSSYNPNDNADWVKAQDNIDKNARLGWGQYNNQLMQNMIGTNMANGSGHQTAAAKQSAMLNSQLAADRANRWQQQYNQNVQNTLAANKQLGDFYNTLSNIGIDYAKLNQQDLSTLLNAYQTQANTYGSILDSTNNALKTWGNAVSMGSDPTETSHQHKEGFESKTTQEQESGWDTAGNVLSTAGTIMSLTSCFVGDTIVSTPNGDVKIKDIKVGDEVYALDSKEDNKVVAKVTEVLDPKEEEIVDVYVVGKLVSTTASQPFLTTDNKFINAEDMAIGETELKPYGVVSYIKVRDKKEKVYDIKISRGNCYFANGFVVKAATNEW